MRLPLPTVSSKHFTYNAKTKTFTSFASDLPRSINFLSPLYDDACDAGFAMVSERTGMLATFCMTRCNENPDDSGDCAWEFEAIGPFNGVLFGLKGAKVVIFND